MPPKKRAAPKDVITLDDAPDAKKCATVNSGKWTSVDDGKVLIYTPDHVVARSEVAAFDIDSTIICTASGRTFAKDMHDWQFLMPQVPGKVNDAYEKDNKKIIFFTNQKGISTGKQPVDGFKSKIEAILKKIRVPVQVFVATSGASKYRKPFTGMWTMMETEHNEGISIDMEKSYFVGDAAGRPVRGKIKKDFTCSDRLFAANLNLKFMTPEEYFTGAKVDKTFTMPSFNPNEYVDAKSDIKMLIDADTSKEVKLEKPKSPEIIVMSGSPGSGKSTLVLNRLLSLGYNHVNRDTLKTWQKCVAAADDALGKGKSVVIDNTNPDVESRKRYVDVAKKHKANVRAFVMNVDQSHATHNNKFRLLKGADAAHLEVGGMVMRMFWGKYVKPNVKEGFLQIVDVSIIPKFENDADEKMYRMWLVEA